MLATVGDLLPGDTYTHNFRERGRGPLLTSEPKTVDRVAKRGRGVLRVWDVDGNCYEAPETSEVDITSRA